MEAKEDDAITALLKQLLKRHPDASDAEMWELFSQAAKHDEEVQAAIEKLRQAMLH